MADLQTLEELEKHVITGTPSNAGVDVATSTTEILAANADRCFLVICNDSDTVIYLGLGAAAVLNKGIRLEPAGTAGSRFRMDWTCIFVGAINGIHGGSGNKVVTVVEADWE